MRPQMFATAAVLLCLMGAVPASAQEDDANGQDRRRQTVFRARMSPSQEVPVCSANGRGSSTFRINDATQEITFELSYALQGTVTVAHVHIGQAFAAGGVSFFLCGGGPATNPKPPCPASPATITGTITAADVVGPAGQGVAAGEFGEVLAAIRAGNTYANVHSNICPGGEVRGQLQ